MNKKNIAIMVLSLIVLVLGGIILILLNNKKTITGYVETKTDLLRYTCTKLVEEYDENDNLFDTVVSKDRIYYDNSGVVTSEDSGYIFEFESEEKINQTIEEINALNTQKTKREDGLKLYIYSNQKASDDELEQNWIKDVIDGKVSVGYECKKN